MPFAEELRASEQGDQWLGEQEHDGEVDEGRQAEGESEAPDVTDREQVQHDRRDERDDIGGDDGATRAHPAAFDRAPQGVPITDLVSKSLEEHDERVGGHADRHDQAGDARESQGVVDGLAEHHDDRVLDRGGQHQAGDCHEGQSAVVEQRIQQHEHQADRTGEQARLEFATAERGRNGACGLLHERKRQCAVLQHVGEVARGLVSEVAGDRRRAGDGALNDFGGVDVRVEHDGGRRTDMRRGELGPGVGRARLERELHVPLGAGLRVELRRGRRDVLTEDQGRVQQVLVVDRRAVRIAAGDQELVRKVFADAALLVGRHRAVELRVGRQLSSGRRGLRDRRVRFRGSRRARGRRCRRRRAGGCTRAWCRRRRRAGRRPHERGRLRLHRLTAVAERLRAGRRCDRGRGRG
jgi:hypothetical protein